MIVAGSTRVTDQPSPGPRLFEVDGDRPADAGEPAVLLAAKSAPPAIRAQVIERAELIEILSAEPSRKLTLLSAPAGWGKTTLLAQWVSEADERRRRGWLSLDASDNDPARFWACAISALGKASPGVAPRALELIRMGADTGRVVLPTLLDELAGVDYQIALVLDDYHLVENRTVHEQVGYVVERLPPTFRLVIATRSDPALPLARLRARGELLELRAEELRFHAGEAADLLDGVLDFKLTDAQVQLLFHRTEGWAAGLYLAGLSLAGRTDAAEFIHDFAGDNRHIVDYLIAEVLDGQPAHIRTFLLRTSLLDRLNGALCDAVLHTNGSASVLETIERDNLFLLPLDVSRRWYRYHQLFADLLRTELRCSEPDLVPLLHQRAAAWFAGEGLTDEAIHHLVAAGDMQGAAELIATSWAAAFNLGRLSTVSGWLDVLPSEIVAHNARLSLARAWVALDSGHLDVAGRWIEAAVPAARTGGCAGIDNIGEKVVVLRAVHRFRSGDLPSALDTARRAVGLDLGSAPVGRPIAFCVYGAALYFSGDTCAAQRAFRTAVSLAENAGNLLAHRYALGYLAVISARQGELIVAEELIRRATGSSRDLADGEHFVDMMVSLATAIILDRRRDVAAAAEAAEMAVGLARRGAGILEVANALLARAEILRHLGENPECQACRTEAAMLLRQCRDTGIVAKPLTSAPRALGARPGTRMQESPVVEELTAKEHEVLRLLATKLSRREIGERLYVSLNTVKTHQRAVYRKLGVENRSAAVTRARELGLR
ncbi:transcriptional regulator [Mycolicibacterium mageritense DSM 44476 = CIP 104973]|uniref:HTH-type transcriptional regulator MalT n=1 Tax=Mycolicibacterium mageritense TaxID=53462 RepID=A0AAI8TSP6_MYCME|nr:LuxR C-terminal-related transcriptional regulator [Mycolicibacterium mageritense]MCC9184503.1 LuxR C-terminal-related transcriptional regulator [Mycolicibacterium mageritense]BBX33257.1 helix-turn-helix transcriptional regulator [Mycolicibacterium mageritense]BDY28144.1 HTH-type transcriptional regulator MalT [Mycolicibacterium mageritense]CDO21690.1 transcriptional regulator [Mycolicibacterium mageritense DSM 44476 = CIP 104973]